MPVSVFITLGSNIEPVLNLQRAVHMLSQNHHLVLQRVSRVYESPAIDATGALATDHPCFLNAAALLESDGHFSPLQIKFNMLRFIELCLGRQRGPDKFAPRPIDLDLALHGATVTTTPRLTLPDPDILTRAHIAFPLAELAPQSVHPVTGQTLAAIAATLADGARIVRRDEIALTW